jgi:glycosyltransferase involved in cell wall biosynthesis
MPNEHMRVKVRLELAIPKRAFVFVYLGRLNQDKGILDLACAFANIQNSKAFLLIVGQDEGSFVEKIKVINTHKSSQVKFVDFTNKPEDYLAASDALCLPSYREGFGSVIIEAAAVGIPAIASDIYGISDAIINKHTGILHTPRDVSSILDAMQFFIKKSELVKKYGDAAMERAKVEFDAKVMSKYWLDFYLQILGSEGYEPQKSSHG